MIPDSLRASSAALDFSTGGHVRRYLFLAIAIGTLSGCTKNSATSPTQTCTYTLSTSTQSSPAEGGQSTVTLTRSQGSCGWTAASDANWITVSSGSGSDSATLTVTVAANGATEARTGRVTVSWTGGTVQLTISQAAAAAPGGCTYTANPTGITIPIGGSSGSVAVTVTGNNCSWSAQSNQFWIHVTSGNGGTGSNTINYTVDPNSGSQRFGRIIITHTLGTIDVSFSQDGGPCTVSVDPTTQAVGNPGGTFSVAVTTPCQWTAASDAAWLTISSAASGTGNGTISYAAAANPGTTARTGHLTVTAGSATAQLTVNQGSGFLSASFTVSPTPCPVAPTGGGSNAISCTFDASSSSGVITSYEFRLGSPTGPVLGTSGIVGNPTVPCGQGGLTGTGSLNVDVILAITGPSGAATRIMSVAFSRNGAC